MSMKRIFTGPSLVAGAITAELNDMGISRADIDRLVWLGEDKDARGRGN